MYRCLNRPGVVYSIQSERRVVAHARSVILRSVRFVILPAGRRRAIKTGQRNVHAFAEGTLVGDSFAYYGPRVIYTVEDGWLAMTGGSFRPGLSGCWELRLCEGGAFGYGLRWKNPLTCTL